MKKVNKFLNQINIQSFYIMEFYDDIFLILQISFYH
jgi:hypothetical protein